MQNPAPEPDKMVLLTTVRYVWFNRTARPREGMLIDNK
jgi:hypothetical protein